MLRFSVLASFPDSTPQLFIALCMKSWGVEYGNEAISVLYAIIVGY